MIKKVISVSLAVLLVIGSLALFGCLKKDDDNTDWQNKGWDLSVPVLNENGWYMVFEDDFNGTALNENLGIFWIFIHYAFTCVNIRSFVFTNHT